MVMRMRGCVYAYVCAGFLAWNVSFYARVSAHSVPWMPRARGQFWPDGAPHEGGFICAPGQLCVFGQFVLNDAVHVVRRDV